MIYKGANDVVSLHITNGAPRNECLLGNTQVAGGFNILCHGESSNPGSELPGCANGAEGTDDANERMYCYTANTWAQLDGYGYGLSHRSAQV